VDVIVVITLVLLTGALHLDGLADAADGLFGGATREQRLEIMHDVHAGTYAIVAVASVLSLKWAGLIAIPSSVRVETLLLFPCLARFAAVLALVTFPYARERGIGQTFRDHAWPSGVVISGAVALTAAIILLGAGGIAALVLVGACGLLLGLLSTRLVGGVTGDTVGGIIEITEAVVVLSIAVGADRGWIEPWALA
jgi:adenosylcobinamide-GDP ribazoletransferase